MVLSENRQNLHNWRFGAVDRNQHTSGYTCPLGATCQKGQTTLSIWPLTKVQRCLVPPSFVFGKTLPLASSLHPCPSASQSGYLQSCFAEVWVGWTPVSGCTCCFWSGGCTQGGLLAWSGFTVPSGSLFCLCWLARWYLSLELEPSVWASGVPVGHVSCQLCTDIWPKNPSKRSIM